MVKWGTRRSSSPWHCKNGVDEPEVRAQLQVKLYLITVSIYLILARAQGGGREDKRN